MSASALSNVARLHPTLHITKAVVGKPAPAFTLKAAQPDMTIGEISLSQFMGKYVVLFFYPLDFSFVCQPRHLAWMQCDRKEGGIGRIRFPLLSDVKHKMSSDYGVMMDEGHTSRATIIISDKGIIRHISLNDPPVGRCITEILRLIRAFQHTDKWGVGCPASWSAGKPTVKTDPVCGTPRD